MLHRQVSLPLSLPYYNRRGLIWGRPRDMFYTWQKSSQCSISVVGTLLALLVRIIHITPTSKAAHFLAAQDFFTGLSKNKVEWNNQLLNFRCWHIGCALASQFARQFLRWEIKTVKIFCTILYSGRTEYCHRRDAIFQSCPIFRVVQREVRSTPYFSVFVRQCVSRHAQWAVCRPFSVFKVEGL